MFILYGLTNLFSQKYSALLVRETKVVPQAKLNEGWGTLQATYDPGIQAPSKHVAHHFQSPLIPAMRMKMERAERM